MERFNVYQFITEVKNRPALWDASCEDYSQRDAKKDCWSQIADVFADKEMSSAEKKILIVELQKRWKNIRTCYAREVKRQKQLQVGETDDRKSEYMYYRKLQFLQKGVRDADSPELPEEFFEDHDIEIEEPPRKVVKVETRQSDFDPFHSIYTEQRSIDRSLSDTLTGADEDKMFLLSLLSTLNALPSRKKMATKIKILSVLHEATEYSD